MTKLTKKRSLKSGLPPGTLVHIGEKKKEEVKITVMDYAEAGYNEKTLKTVDECFLLRDRPAVTWINVEGVHDVKILEKLGECFGLHPLIQEDIINTDQRPKIEDYDNYLYIVLKMLYLNKENNGIVTEQISLILGKNFVVSFQEGIEGDVFDLVRERIRTDKGRIRKMSADYLVQMGSGLYFYYFVLKPKLTGRAKSCRF